VYRSLARNWKSSSDRLKVLHWLSIFCPLPHLTGWYEGRTLNTESRQKVLQYSMLLSHRSMTAQWFSPHHHYCQHLTSSTSPEKSKLTLLWAVNLPVLVGPVATSSCFLTLISVSLATVHVVQPPCLTTTRTIWPEWNRSLVMPFEM
jgi:hypothetical protein